MNKGLGVVLLASIGSSVFGQGLFSIPSGDVLPPGLIAADYQLNGARVLNSADTFAILGLRFGLTNRLTIGADFLTTGTAAGSPNISLSIIQNGFYSAAIGYENVGVRSFGEQPYAAASLNIRPVRLHIGWTRGDSDSAMFGLEYATHNNLVLQVDTITGNDNFTTVGIQWNMSDSAALAIGEMVPNERSAGDGLFVDLSYTFQLGKKHETK